MTQPGIESQTPRPLANTLPYGPMYRFSRLNCVKFCNELTALPFTANPTTDYKGWNLGTLGISVRSGHKRVENFNCWKFRASEAAALLRVKYDLWNHWIFPSLLNWDHVSGRLKHINKVNDRLSCSTYPICSCLKNLWSSLHFVFVSGKFCLLRIMTLNASEPLKYSHHIFLLSFYYFQNYLARELFELV